jgi:SOS response regulatory protein OraA/RecX
MSSSAVPFEPTTTPTIERANRLISLRTHPGFLDVLRISQEIVQSAIDTCINYPGWDDKQMAMLAVRQKCAKEHHELLIAKINEAIREGVSEQAVAANLPEKTPSEIVENGDFVRQEVLTKFDEMSENRPAGSY